MRKFLFSILILTALSSNPAVADSGSIAYIDQMGSNNRVSLTQQGTNNVIQTHQEGTENRIRVDQTKNKNYALVYQFGANNTATGTQTGKMQSIITQHGNGHVAEFSSNVRGEQGKPITITQYGTGAKVSMQTFK
jgi:hypothetical protein